MAPSSTADKRARERSRSIRDWSAIVALGLANLICFAAALFLLFRFLREWA